MDVTLIEWAQRAYWVLNAERLAGRKMFYSDLAKAIGYERAIWHAEFAAILEIVLLADVGVASTAVSKETGEPGKGFLDAVERHGLARKLALSVADGEGVSSSDPQSS